MIELAGFANQKNDDDQDDSMKAFNLFTPNADDIKKMRDLVDTASGEQKKLFLIIVQWFIMILSDHIIQCESSSCSFYTPWLKHAIK